MIRGAAAERLAAAALEACWLGTGLALLAPRLAPGAPAPALLLAGLPLAWGLGRAAFRLSAARRLPLLLSGTAIYLATALATWGAADGGGTGGRLLSAAASLTRIADGPNAAQLALGAAGLTWACGLRLAARPAAPGRLVAEFQFGLLVLGLLFFVAVQAGVALAGMGPTAALFFTVFLVGAAAARAPQAAAGAPAPRAAAAVAVVLVLSIGALIAAVVTPELVAAVVAGLMELGSVVAAQIARFFRWLAALLPPPEIAPGAASTGGAMPAPPGGSLPDLLRIPEGLRRAAGLLVAGFWIVLIALSLWRIAAELAAWLARRAAGDGEARVARLEGGLLQELRRLAAWFADRIGGLVRRLRRRAGRAPKRPAPAGAQAVRRRYRRLLAWAARRGCRRRPGQTPNEFLPALVALRPAAAEEFARLTEIYIAVRYGGLDPDPPTLREIAAAWRRVKAAAAPRRPPGHRGGMP